MLEKWLHHSAAKLIPFSATKKYENGAYVEDGAIYFHGEKVIETVRNCFTRKT